MMENVIDPIELKTLTDACKANSFDETVEQYHKMIYTLQRALDQEIRQSLHWKNKCTHLKAELRAAQVKAEERNKTIKKLMEKASDERQP